MCKNKLFLVNISVIKKKCSEANPLFFVCTQKKQRVMTKRIFSNGGSIFDSTPYPTFDFPSNLSNSYYPVDTSDSFIENSYDVQSAKRRKTAGNRSSGDPVNDMTILPMPWDNGVDKHFKTGDLVFRLNSDTYTMKPGFATRAIATSTSQSNYKLDPVLPFAGFCDVCKREYDASVNEITGYIAQGLDSMGYNFSGEKVTAFYGSERVDDGVELNSVATTAEAASKIKKQRARASKLATRISYLLEQDELIVDLDLLRKVSFCRDPLRDRRMISEEDSYKTRQEEWLEKRRRFLGEIKESCDRDNQEFANISGAGGTGTIIAESWDVLKGKMTDSYKDWLDDYELDGASDKAVAVYQLEQVYKRFWDYICPDLVFARTAFLGSVISSLYEKFTPASTSRSYDDPTGNIGVRNAGLHNVFNVMSPGLRPNHKVYCTLVRHFDVSTGVYSYVRPTFSYGYTKLDAMNSLEPYKERYVSHVDLKVCEKLVTPSSGLETWTIGTVKQQYTAGAIDQKSYRIAQMIENDCGLNEALEIRNKLPKVTIMVGIDT